MTINRRRPIKPIILILFCLFLSFSVSSCTIYKSDGSTVNTLSNYCAQAYNQGWCSDQCPKKPTSCGPFIVGGSCSYLSCRWQLSDGSFFRTLNLGKWSN